MPRKAYGNNSLFSENFVKKFSEEIICHAYFSDDVSGSDWERIFANCIGAEWKPGLALYDVVDTRNSVAWSAKTVKSNFKLERLGLISGRISYSNLYDEHELKSPDEVGRYLLDKWNTRVSKVKAEYDKFYNVVLLRNKNRYKIFYYGINYEPYENCFWEWKTENKQPVLYCFDDKGNKKYAWLTSGGQFYLIKDIPTEYIVITVTFPSKLTKDEILKAVNFNETMYQSEYHNYG